VRAEEDERGYYISLNSVTPEPAPLLKPAAKADFDRFAVVASAADCLLLFAWGLPLLEDLSALLYEDRIRDRRGSYTVIPYVAQVTVSKLHWLTSSQMTDGFALAETTPGPLIIVVAFVGFMAGYNHFHGSLWMGTLGLLATTFYTFLPCFLFVFAGAPLVEQTRGKADDSGCLATISLLS